MIVAHDTKLVELTKRLTELETEMRQFSKKTELHDVIEMIKIKKGWTTPAEMAFATAIVKNMHTQMQQLNTLLASFSSAARQVQVTV
jgi:hypothetical protein